MLDISLILMLQHLFFYLILPIIPGILFIWLMFGTKFKGLSLYIYSWFIGIGVISFFIYNLQLFVFGIGKTQYFILLLLLLISFIFKIKYSKFHFKDYINTLKIENKFKQIKDSFAGLVTIQKVLTVTMVGYVLIFLVLGFAYNVTFPTYFDDSFGNWNLAAIHMYFDGGYNAFGERNEILGRGGRVDYPIFISIFKALVANFTGYWYDIYQNMYQFISFFFLVIFSFIISFKKSKNIFLSIIPATLITGISLVFFHIIDGYYDLVCGIYSVFVIYFIYKFLDKYNYTYLLMGLLFGVLLINIKNDAFVVYFPGIMFALISYLYFKGDLLKVCKGFFTKLNVIKMSLITLFFIIPPFFMRFYHDLAFNPQAHDGVENTKLVHTEIFSSVDDIFILENNYNLVLLFIPILFYKYFKGKNSFILLSFLFIFLIFVAVFLFTTNYRWVLDQTTVNRVFMSSFVILFSFFTIIYSEKN